QGLKIAVAALATFTVLFASTTYYFYSDGSKAKAAADAAKKAASEAATQQTSAEEALKNLGVALGYANLKAGEGGTFAEVDSIKGGIMKAVNSLRANAEAQIKSKVPDAPQVRAELAKSQDLAVVLEDQERAANKLRANPSADLKSMVENLNDLLKSATDTEVAFFLDNYNLRKALANVNTIHDGQIKSVQDELKKVKDDLAAEQKSHEEGRVDLTESLDSARRETNQKDTDLAAIQGEQARDREKHAIERSDLRNQMINLRERIERKEDVLDVKDGTITFVDYGTKQVRLDITRAMGIRPTMRFTIFDRKAVGLPSDKPKGQIEVTEVGNQYSIGRIIETRDLAKPIVAGDLLYSAAWNASEPQEFALIGKLDLNQDSKDDRDDIKRLISSAGGKIGYDLVLRKGETVEEGKLSGRIAWYVDDDRPLSAEQLNALSVAERDFEARKSEVLREARSLGIRPLPLTRLPGTLGYTFRNLRTSPVEGVDRKAMKELATPAGRKAAEPAEKPADGETNSQAAPAAAAAPAQGGSQAIPE
ncbi:MAG: hypothetical protein ACKO5E_05740, partial [bacterium]